LIFNLFRKDPQRIALAKLYQRIADASRNPGLYDALGIPDTIEGRFESLSIHTILMLRALRNLPPPADDVAKDLTDAFFQDLDASLREMGSGDTVVPKRMKKLAAAFYGRAHAYDGPIDAGNEAALAVALGRNAVGSDLPAPALARYVLAADRSLRASDLAGLLGEAHVFPEPATFGA
jgi:cytochrome b pre-mRNA-processing protein 3